MGQADLTAIDLFSGCGGLSLGLERAGFVPKVAVELSAMAAETHFANFHQRDLPWDQVAWEEHQRGSIREQAEAGTVVRSILDVVKDDEAMALFEELEPDVVAGGPPCQGFSMAGRRDPNDLRNALPWAFLDFVEVVKPRAVIIENVVGINRAFRRAGAEAPFEQLRRQLAITGPGYLVQPLEVNAKHFGVPQNRPRMLLIGVSREVAGRLQLNEPSPEPWRSQDAVRDMVRGAWDPENLPLVPVPTHGPVDVGDLDPYVTVGQAFADLDEDGYRWSSASRRYDNQEAAYAQLMRQRPDGSAEEQLRNHTHRRHGDRVVERFRLYQYFRDEGLRSDVMGIPFVEPEDEARARLRRALDGREGMPRGVGQPGEDLVDAIFRLRTKKYSQKAIAADQPAPTVVTLPDDYVHPTEPRIMTVRELARLQSFPDWFEFRSKETTGSHRRKVEVPQFSQVGNAVPPLLAEHVALRLRAVLTAADQRRAAA